MTDRTVRVTLTAVVSGYLQGMDQLARKTREAGSEADKLAQKRQAFTLLGTSLLALGVAAAAGIGLTIAKYAEFDQAMSNANAILQESEAGQNSLRDAALEAGGATVFTATQSANAIEELGKAGTGTADILGGALTGSLNLAASGQLGVARAAEITGITLKQFSLDGSEAGRVADVLSAGANKAVGSVEDLAQGLKFVGPVAAGMNVSLEDTVATLALFSDNGVLGEQAGTSFRGMLSSLTSPSKLAGEELKRLGISLYDGEGRFLGIQNAAGELHRTLNGVSDAERDMSLGILFGNQQLTAARILVDAGAETWRVYRDAVDDSGIAARIAAERMDNLSGDIEKLGGAFDTALIQTGSGANDSLRTLVQSATFLIDAIGELPEPVLTAGLALAGVVAVVGLVGGAALLAVPKIAAFREAMNATTIGARAASLATAGVGAAVALATFVIGAFVEQAARAAASSESFADSLDQASGAATNYTRDLAIKRLEEEKAFEIGEKIGLSQKEITDALLEGGDAWQIVSDKIREYAIAHDSLGGPLVNTANHIRGIRDELEGGIESWQNAKAAAADNVPTLTEIADGAADARAEIAGLSDELRNFGSLTYDVIDAELKFRQSIDEATVRVGEEGFTSTLDRATQAGRDNWNALLDMGSATKSYAAAAYDAHGSQEELNAILGEGWQKLYDAAIQYGATEAEAKSYADQLIATPAVVATRADLDTSDAERKLADFKASLAAFQSSSYGVNISGYINSLDRFKGGFEDHMVQAFAKGGMPSGIYSGGPVYKFAEKHLPWEAFISPDPNYRSRNIGVWQEAGERLGVWRQAQPSQGGSGDIASAIAGALQSQGPTRLAPETIYELANELASVVERRTRVTTRAGVM